MDGTGALRAFIGSFTSSGGQGITQTEVDPRTGALTATATVATVPDPSYLAVGHRDTGRPVVYCVSETARGAVAAYDVSGPGLRPLGDPVQVHGAEPTHLAVCQDHLVTANYGSGSVSVLPLAADGTPRSPSSRLQHEGHGPHPERQSAPHAHQVVQDPSGRWVLSVDLGTDSVRVCALETHSGALSVHSTTRLPPGTGPRHLAFHPRGEHAYVLGELRPTVAVCRWDAATGALRQVGECALFQHGADVPVQPSAPVVSHDGRHMWAAVRGTDSIVVLSLDETGDRPEVVTSVPCGGRWPRDLVLHPSGSWLYAANERSGDVTWFDLDRTGVPRRAGALTVPSASSVVFV
ncbi:lactonase family protein [Streptomyces sp. NPDC052013]|uniref:lactonase family protein n=1 Tax=Streptomyces sp. NPDC052013 TaxID=3365679 RepID=UPI0037D06FEE